MWNILLIEEKRTITGIKVRLQCKYIDIDHGSHNF
jgi:hypothetical protein